MASQQGPPPKLPPINFNTLSSPQSFTLKISDPSTANSANSVFSISTNTTNTNLNNNNNNDNNRNEQKKSNVIKREYHSLSQPPPNNDNERLRRSPAPNKRIRGVKICKSIIYGNVTHRLEGSPDYSAIKGSNNNNNATSSFEPTSSRRNSRNSSYETQDWFRFVLFVFYPSNKQINILFYLFY